MRFFEGADHLREDGQILPGVAHINSNCKAVLVVFMNLNLGNQCGQQADGQIVDTVKAHILQDMERCTLT